MIIVNDNQVQLRPGDVRFFRSPHVAAFELEVYDVGDPSIHIFSSEGMQYKLEADPTDANRVRLQAVTSSRLSEHQVRSFILEAIKRSGLSSEVEMDSLSNLKLEALCERALKLSL